MGVGSRRWGWDGDLLNGWVGKGVVDNRVEGVRLWGL